jgi:hypothetical protein
MRKLRLAFVLGLVGALVSPAGAIDGPCKLATKGDSVVAKACVKGGAKAAKKEMDALVKKAKEKTGTKPECSDCHDGVDDGRYDVLKKDGRKRFDELIAALSKK